MNRFVPLALAVCAMFAFVVATPAQVFRSTTQTVAIYATVLDSDSHLVTDLNEKAFEVYDNGVLKPLTLFKSDVQPITVVVMLDTSGSMTFDIELLKDAAERFVLRMLPADRARVGSFNEKIFISPQFTSNRDELIRIIHNDLDFGNGTYLWDALDKSMSAIANETGRRVVLLFTDGEDDKSQVTNFKTVLGRAVNEDFMIYAIGKQTNVANHLTHPDRNLPPLAAETGGGYYGLKVGADLNSTFTKVADELHRQYVLGFSADNLDGKVHKLDVRLKVPGMTVRARKSYLASKTGIAAEPAASK
jgi:Ca-activated chloride channel family protein